MTTVIGIFDNSPALEKAVTELSQRGFDEKVFDQNALAQESGGAGLVFTPAIRRLFYEHLADYRLPEEIIESYVNSFAHGGKFVVIKVNQDRAEEALGILEQSGASRTNRHG